MFNENIYINRRRALSDQINEGVILLLGNMPVPMNYLSNTLRFRQDSNFLYYSGLDHPNLNMAIDVLSGETTLFGDDIDVDDIVWEGERITVKKMSELSGIEHVEKNSFLSQFLSSKNKFARFSYFDISNHTSCCVHSTRASDLDPKYPNTRRTAPP